MRSQTAFQGVSSRWRAIESSPTIEVPILARCGRAASQMQPPHASHSVSQYENSMVWILNLLDLEKPLNLSNIPNFLFGSLTIVVMVTKSTKAWTLRRWQTLRLQSYFKAQIIPTSQLFKPPKCLCTKISSLSSSRWASPPPPWQYPLPMLKPLLFPLLWNPGLAQ